MRGLLGTSADFRRLWAADLLSTLGTQVTMLAFPLVAVSTLHASPMQVGLLVTAESLAFLLVGLPAGAWCDRLPRRPVLIAADLVRAAALVSVPVAALAGVLALPQLYAVAAVTGLCTVFFDVAHLSYLPALVGRDQVVAGNGLLMANQSVGVTAGPALAGLLVQWWTAPYAVLADAASFLWSAAWLSRIHRPEVRPPPVERHLGREVAEGVRFVWRHPVLRAVSLFGATSVIFLTIDQAVAVVFLARTIRLAPAGIGMLFTIGSLGAIAGALSANRLVRRWGPARVLLRLPVAGGLCALLIPLTGPGLRLVCYAVGNAALSFAIVNFNVVSVSFRQRLTPDHLLGRVNATVRFLIWGMIPVGGALGGALGQAAGPRAALWVAAVGLLAATSFLIFSPVRGARDLPADPPAAPPSGPDVPPVPRQRSAERPDRTTSGQP